MAVDRACQPLVTLENQKIMESRTLQVKTAAFLIRDVPEQVELGKPRNGNASANDVTTAQKIEKTPRSTTKKSPGGNFAVNPTWLKLPELQAAMCYADGRGSSLANANEQELVQRTKAILKHEIGLIFNAEFSSRDAAKRIFESLLGLRPTQAEVALANVRCAGAYLPIHVSGLNKTPLLTAAQESALFQRMNFLRHQAAVLRLLLSVAEPSVPRLLLLERLLLLADWHRNRIVEANTRLVFSIVKKFVNANNLFDDLLSDGMDALIHAVEKFNYDRGFRFSTYATQVVRRTVYREIMQNQQERTKMVAGLQDMDIYLSDEKSSPAISESRWHELRSRLSQMLGDLDRRQKFIIRARFSLGSHRRVQTLQALADRLGVSKERVRQLERMAMDKLRAMAGEAKPFELEV